MFDTKKWNKELKQLRTEGWPVCEWGSETEAEWQARQAVRAVEHAEQKQNEIYVPSKSTLANERAMLKFKSRRKLGINFELPLDDAVSTDDALSQLADRAASKLETNEPYMTISCVKAMLAEIVDVGSTDKDEAVAMTAQFISEIERLAPGNDSI